MDAGTSTSRMITRTLSSNSTTPLNLEVETTDSLTPIAGHICVSYRGCLICWGGYCYDEREIHYRECNWLYIFPYMLCGANNRIWLKVQCETDLQLRPNSGATAGIHRDQLYIFGGCLFDDVYRRMVNTSVLICIDLRTGALRAKPTNGRLPTPRDKTTSWIADEKFFVFGGYGMSWHRLDHATNEYFFHPQSFLEDDIGSCWNNQLLCYDLKRECWKELEQGGKKPTQRAAAASVHVPELNQVFLFGGRHDQTRLNDLYVLDLASIVWTQIDISSTTCLPGLLHRQPEGRSWCSMVRLKSQKKILLYGGLCSRGQPLGDIWELDIQDFYDTSTGNKRRGSETKRKFSHWRQIPPLEHKMPARLWHCAVLMRDEAILIYGGMNEAPSRDSPFVGTLLFQPLQPPTLRQLALNGLADYIIEQWMAEIGTWKGINSIHNTMRQPSTFSPPMDVHSFANDGFYFADLPPSLHPQLRCLLSIRKHSQVLSPTAAGGGNTPREISPFHRRQNSPINFHLLNFDGRMGDSDNAADDEDDEASFGMFLGVGSRRRSHHRSVPPLSPKSQKRALADELVKQICESAKTRAGGGLPFLQALFNAFDPL